MFHLFLKKENPHSDTFLHLNEGSLHFYRLFFDWNNSIIALGVVAAVHMVADKWHTVPNIEYVLSAAVPPQPTKRDAVMAAATARATVFFFMKITS